MYRDQICLDILIIVFLSFFPEEMKKQYLELGKDRLFPYNLQFVFHLSSDHSTLYNVRHGWISSEQYTQIQLVPHRKHITSPLQREPVTAV
jgi:hypothetical protein